MDAEPPQKRNDVRRMAELWPASQPVITAFILGHVRDFHDAEDLLQETAVTVADKFEEYDPARPFVPWVLGIARLKILAYYRKSQRFSTLVADDVLARTAKAFSERTDMLESLRRALDHCLKKLPERARRLLELRHVREMKPRDIARYLGHSPAATRAALYRVRLALARCIDQVTTHGWST
jgi:RNA polymerase sigma-70 factor (ECF subfamily)